MEREQQPKRSVQFLTIATMVCMIIATTSLVFLPDVDAPSHIELSLMGDHTRAVEPGQSVAYIIKVQNKGDYRIRSYDLILSAIPDGWEAELSKTSITLDSREYELTKLTITAPLSSDYDNVAYISVRGDDDCCNKTKKVGTTTYTTGSTATVLRQGIETTLRVGDDIRSEDRIWTHEESTIAYRLDNLFFSTDIYTILTPESEIYVGYQTSQSPLVRNNHTGFDLLTTSVIKGKVYFYQEGISSNDTPDVSPSVKAQTNLTATSFVDINIPKDGFRESTLFSVEVDPDDHSIVTTMYRGAIDITSKLGAEELVAFHSITVQQDGTMGTADWISRDIVTGSGNAELNITVDGKLINTMVNDVPDTDVLPVGDTNIFILPFDTRYSIVTNSLGIRDYSLTILHQREDTTTSYTFSDIVAADWTRDRYEWDPVREMITFGSNDEKKYDLEISSRRGEVGSVLTITDVDLFPEEEQSYQVMPDKWEVLDDPDERPVKYTRGEESVYLGTGMDGNDINKLLEEQGKEKLEHMELLAFLILLLIILLIGLFTITRWYPYYEDLFETGDGLGAAPSEDSEDTDGPDPGVEEGEFNDDDTPDWTAEDDGIREGDFGDNSSMEGEHVDERK